METVMSLNRVCRSWFMFLITIVGFILACGKLPAFIINAFVKEASGKEIDQIGTALAFLMVLGLIFLPKIFMAGMRNNGPNELVGYLNPVWVRTLATKQTMMTWYPSGLHFGLFFEHSPVKMALENNVLECKSSGGIETQDSPIFIQGANIVWCVNADDDGHINRHFIIGKDAAERKANTNTLLLGWLLALIQSKVRSITAVEAVRDKQQIISLSITEIMQATGGLDHELGVSIISATITDLALSDGLTETLTGQAELEVIGKMEDILKARYPSLSGDKLFERACILTGHAHLILGGRGRKGRGIIADVGGNPGHH